MADSNVVYIDDMTATVGSNTTSNVESFSFREVSNRPFPYAPVLVMGTPEAVGFRPAHYWIEGEIKIKSEAVAVFVQKTTAVDTFAVAITKLSTGTETYTFHGTIFAALEFIGNHDDEGYTTYRFVALHYVKS